MVFSTSLLIGLVSIFLHVTPCLGDINCPQAMATFTEKPFEVVLGNPNRTVFCGGTLITNFYVLTAAECVIDRQPNTITAFTGITSLSTRYNSVEVRAVVEIIVYTFYDRRKPWNNNIALLRLGRLFHPTNCVFDPWVNKGIVPQKDELNEILKQKHLSVRLSGFGINFDTKRPKSNELLEFHTYVVDLEYCKRMYQVLQYNISDRHICAYDPDTTLLFKEYRISDVGSPLIINQNVILGIALNLSSAYYSGIYYPMLFTNVSYYRDWIQHIISTYDENDLEIASALETRNPEQVFPS